MNKAISPLNAKNNSFTPPSQALPDAVFDHSESPNPLIEDDLNADPTPGPVPPPKNQPGVQGKCGITGRYRLPTADEFIDDNGQIRSHLMWQPRKRRRALSKLNTPQEVQKEMARLYADFHHRRIAAPEFTKAIYGLDCLARAARMAAKG